MTTEPLTPPECDLRSYPYMPLDVVRLRDSDITTVDAEAFRAAVLSWCVAWHQMPAASLPDDDITLCRLLGYGRDLKGWKKVRAAGALRGYVKCSDGRLYHPVVAEKALESWQKKLAQRDRTEAARVARLSQRVESSVTEIVTDGTTQSVTSSKENKENNKGEEATDARAARDADAVFEGKESQPASGRRANGRFHGFAGKMPNLNSPWSAWEILTDGEVEVCGANAQRRPCAGGFYVDEVARLVAEAAQIDGHSGHIDWRPMIGWLKAGYDSETIVGVVKRIAAKAGYEPKTNLNYFTPALTGANGKADR